MISLCLFALISVVFQFFNCIPLNMGIKCLCSSCIPYIFLHMQLYFLLAILSPVSISTDMFNFFCCFSGWCSITLLTLINYFSKGEICKYSVFRLSGSFKLGTDLNNFCCYYIKEGMSHTKYLSVPFQICRHSSMFLCLSFFSSVLMHATDLGETCEECIYTMFPQA